ncbi:hypothetical protein V1478_016018 [Vespula squamosa]|uniref:Uncharacterized protein n=1 Tax=Vespula squamosa TaxID=30214 RepID=A0ABD2A2K6_VESSQ
MPTHLVEVDSLIDVVPSTEKHYSSHWTEVKKGSCWRSRSSDGSNPQPPLLTTQADYKVGLSLCAQCLIRGCIDQDEKDRYRRRGICGEGIWKEGRWIRL